MQKFLPLSRFGLLTLFGLTVLLPGIAQQSAKPYKIFIVGEQEKLAERTLRPDPKIRVEYSYTGTWSSASLRKARSLLLQTTA